MMASETRFILITGASNGIGKDSTHALVSASPNNHVIMGVRNMDKGQAVLKELQARNPQGTLSLVHLDVTNDDTISAAVKTIDSDFGRIDVLVNNAGVHFGLPASRENLRATFETNVFGPMLLTQSCESLLRKSKDPRVINVSSILGSINRRTDPSWLYYQVPADQYQMSKAALNMLSACQNFHYKDFGCKVWSFCPGFVVTDLTGAEDRQNRINRGAESSETSARGILEIVEGKRDGEVNQFVERYGKVSPW
ncbi:hypothetical protein BCR34DRAFT_268744 [Clohesyomyces aquaticus]|uniref:Short chain dehydrogenase n=1 Tax=Clohesyomyces aquaticus TaxID=1231657 RepID=A0A1Y1ZUF2_9PLEO|nr:hypothetical protein BCR34DRAFT_268744 [Clohesyomyces aquaticus]